MHEQIVHCPRCGAALMIKPRISTVTVRSASVVFEFESGSVRHECPDE